MAQHLTIKQIAELAGVSVGTVDRILHNRGRVSAESYAAVQAVLDTQPYKCNLHTSAVALKKTNKSFRIVVSIPSSEEGEYWDLIRSGIDKALQEYGDISIKTKYVFFDQFSSLSCRDAFNEIASLNCSAAILGTTFVEETRELCARLDDKRTPYVFVDGKVSGTKPVATFLADQDACGRLMARLMDGLTPEGKELALLLPKRIGAKLSNNSAIRLVAFKAFFKETKRKRTIREGFFSAESAEKSRKDIFSFLKLCPKVGGVAAVISTAYLIADTVSAMGDKNMIVGGFDVTDGNARCLKDGNLDFLINQHPEEQGFNAVESLLHYLLYGALDKNIREYHPIGVVFKENLPFWQEES